MSNFYARIKIKATGKIVEAQACDDNFGIHQYGYKVQETREGYKGYWYYREDEIELLEPIEPKKAPCSCPKGGRVGIEERPCELCGGTEWVDKPVVTKRDLDMERFIRDLGQVFNKTFSRSKELIAKRDDLFNDIIDIYPSELTKLRQEFAHERAVAEAAYSASFEKMKMVNKANVLGILERIREARHCIEKWEEAERIINQIRKEVEER